MPRQRNNAAPKAAAAAPEKPRLGFPDPLSAALEEARHAKEGNHKLSLSVDALRTGLETIVHAEWDRVTNQPVTPRDLRAIAVNALDEYSRLCGQNWRRNPIRESFAGDRSLNDAPGGQEA